MTFIIIKSLKSRQHCLMNLEFFQGSNYFHKVFESISQMENAIDILMKK